MFHTGDLLPPYSRDAPRIKNLEWKRPLTRGAFDLLVNANCGEKKIYPTHKNGLGTTIDARRPVRARLAIATRPAPIALQVLWTGKAATAAPMAHHVPLESPGSRHLPARGSFLIGVIT